MVGCMVLTLDGRSEQIEHVWTETGNFYLFNALVYIDAFVLIYIFQFTLTFAQHILSYDRIKVPWHDGSQWFAYIPRSPVDGSASLVAQPRIERRERPAPRGGRAIHHGRAIIPGQGAREGGEGRVPWGIPGPTKKTIIYRASP